MSSRVRRLLLTFLFGLFPGAAALAAAQVPTDPPAGRPDAIIDLASKDGAALVGATWRYRDAKLVAVAARAPGPDLRPSGAPIRAIDVSPSASEAFGEDPGWARIAPDGLETRRGNGKVSFAWYRLDLTLPERVGSTPVAGSTVAFEVVVDDYAEVWVDGKLPLVLGQTGGPAVKGFNAPNRVVVAQDARPGQRIRLAVFAINGPLSASPNNFIWIRSATLEVHRARSDLVYRSDGALYFTDPPFGLPKAFDDKRKELPYSGVFCLKDGKLELVSTDLTGPNGIAFSPDERYLYVTNWDVKRKVVMRYEVRPQTCELSNGQVFFDMTSAPGEEALDGMKVDREGHLFVSGPGGLWIISPEGKHLGTIQAPELPANMAFGDADGRTLYMAARTGVYRIRLSHEGVRPPLARASN
jgi:hypothetical protein